MLLLLLLLLLLPYYYPTAGVEGTAAAAAEDEQAATASELQHWCKGRVNRCSGSRRRWLAGWPWRPRIMRTLLTTLIWGNDSYDEDHYDGDALPWPFLQRSTQPLRFPTQLAANQENLCTAQAASRQNLYMKLPCVDTRAAGSASSTYMKPPTTTANSDSLLTSSERK